MAGYRDSIVSGASPQPTAVRTPKGFDNEAAFLDDMRRKYSDASAFNEHNVIAGKDDAKFIVGNQWDPIIEARRKRLNKPILTFNRLVAFLAQIVCNRLMNETEIRVYPDKDGTKEIAELREGLIRSIFKNSNADFARDEAHKYQVIGGQGAYCLSLDYTSDDVFEQEIRIKAISDPYAAVFDPGGIEPSGEDCQWAFVGDDIPLQDFKKRWPKAAATSFFDSNRWNSSGYWMTEDCVRIVSFWQMVTDGTKTLALFQDGTVHDVSDMEEYEYINLVDTRSDGSPYVREVPKRFARLYICSGNAILEGPFDYPISSIPVYRVPGWEVNDGERVHRWGLVRFLKDPQRLENFWRSTIAEGLVAAPRNKFLTTPDAVKGHEARWRRSPSSDDPFLYYNDGEIKPERIPPPPMDGALLNEAGLAKQDLKDISNIHEASLGMPSNEVSKVAIQQRQMVSDVGTAIYSDRLRIADERCAKNINELIPYIYDTQRMITVIGSDDKAMVKLINAPADPNSDVTMGKYAITVSVGPATETKRTLAAEQMMAFVNAMPQMAEPVMPLIAEAQDWPKAGEFAKVFKLIVAQKFPGVVPDDELTPEMQAMQQQQQQMAAVQQQLADALQQAKTADLNSRAANSEARANLAQAQAYKAIADAQSRQADTEGKNDDREYRQILDTLDQHNDLEAEDRDFRLRATETVSRMTSGEQDNAQGTGGGKPNAGTGAKRKSAAKPAGKPKPKSG